MKPAEKFRSGFKHPISLWVVLVACMILPDVTSLAESHEGLPLESRITGLWQSGKKEKIFLGPIQKPLYRGRYAVFSSNGRKYEHSYSIEKAEAGMVRIRIYPSGQFLGSVRHILRPSEDGKRLRRQIESSGLPILAFMPFKKKQSDELVYLGAAEPA